MARIESKQMREAVKKLMEELGRAATYKDLSDHFSLNSAAHARYYVTKAEEDGVITVDRTRQPHWVSAS